VISIILYGRNDSHGYNLHKRAALSLNCLAETLTHSGDEIVFVDCNTPDDMPTFPEAILDTLSPRARELLRVIRLRPAQYEQHKRRSPLKALEPLARNIAIRRSNPANRWVLSTNTDMAFIPRPGWASLSDAVADLPDGLYELPRFEVPEMLWETLDRRDPQSILRTFDRWGRALHLNHVVKLWPHTLFDAPGDFQLMLREQIFAIHGFHDAMVLGWHVDSNLCKRLWLLNGATESLLERVHAYHCDHTRYATSLHKGNRTENDWRVFVDAVTTPYLPEQAETWGLPDENLEELRLTDEYAGRFARVLEDLLPGLSGPSTEEAYVTGTLNHGLLYDFDHALPFIADHLVTLAPEAEVAYVGGNIEMLRRLTDFRARYAHTGRLLFDAALLPDAAPLSANCAPAAPDQLLERAALFVFDFGMQTFPQARNAAGVGVPAPSEAAGAFAWKLYDRLIELARAENERAAPIPRKFIFLGAPHTWAEPTVMRVVEMVQTPYSSHLRHGYVRPDAFSCPLAAPALHTLFLDTSPSALCARFSAELKKPVSEADLRRAETTINLIAACGPDLATRLTTIRQTQPGPLEKAVLRLWIEIAEYDRDHVQAECCRHLLSYLEAAQPAQHVRPKATNGAVRPLRVLFVNRPDTLTLPGGDTTHLLNLKAALEKLGVEVALSTALSPDPAGFDLINVFNLLLPALARHQLSALRAATRAPIVLTPFFWDVSESLWGETVVPEAVAAAKTPAELQGALTRAAAGTLADGRRTRSGQNRPYSDYELDQRLALQFADHLIPISVRERAALAQTLSLADRAMSVIPTGVAEPEPAAAELFAAEYDVRDFVLVSGRVEPRKNQLLLLHALREAGLPIVVTGAQPAPAYLELCRQAAPQALFVGWLSAEKLASARAAARVHALASWWETAGLASLEAALAGCAVVMGDRAAERDYFGEGAYYCDPADVASIRQAVLAAYHEYPTQAERRSALQTRIRRECNWGTVAEQTLALYRQLAATPVAAHSGHRRDLARAVHNHLQGRSIEAQRALSPALRNGAATALSLTVAGDVAMALGQAAQAASALQRAAALEPDNPTIQRRLGKALALSGQVAPAYVALRRAVELDPRDVDARFCVGELAARAGQWAQAVEHLKPLAEEEPHHVQIQALLGECYFQLGELGDARARFEQALKLEPNLPVAIKRLKNWPAGSKAAAQPAPVRRAPSAAEVFQQLLEAGDVAAALADAQRAGTLNTEVLDIIQRNADLARGDGDAELAEGLEALAEAVTEFLAVGVPA
jgi:glycosyltransferase involved in cell wall biosynthesis/Tfp pilus assembly protein PilF